MEAIRQRIKHPECGAGCVFDNLYSKHIANDETMVIGLLMKAVGTEALRVVELYGIFRTEPKVDEHKNVKQNVDTEEAGSKIF